MEAVSGMQALWIDTGELSFRADVYLPAPARDEARVRVLKAGICGTDLALLAGLYPFEGVPGHEFVGRVESGPAALAGRRVVCEINATCGRCDYCRSRLAKHCVNRTALGIRGRHGAFAEHLNVPACNLHALPDEVPTALGVFAEPLAAAIDASEHVESLAQPVLVLGPGRLGQLVCRVLSARGARVVAAGRHPGKLARLAAFVESTVLVDDLPRRAFHAAVDCTGSPAGLALAIGALRARGTLVMKSTCPGAVEIDAGRIVVDELRVLGSRCGHLPDAVAMLGDESLGLESLIDAVYPLRRGIEAFQRSRDARVIKVLLDMEGPAVE